MTSRQAGIRAVPPAMGMGDGDVHVGRHCARSCTQPVRQQRLPQPRVEHKLQVRESDVGCSRGRSFS